MNTAQILVFPEHPTGQFRSNRMDNQKLGYVPLYRSIKKKSWAKDVYLRTLWEDLLFGAQRKPRTVNFKGNQWNLQVGQLVVTAADLGLSLCDRDGKPTSRDAVGRMLNFFVKEGMISMDGEKRKGTVITILNYAEYAEKTDNLPAHKAAHYPALKPAHHEQEGNNNNIKNLTSENSNESPDESKNKIRPDAAIQTPKGDKWGTADDLKLAEWMFQKIKNVSPLAATPNWPSWSNDIRLMRNALEVTHRDICDVFKWANGDHFWQTNVMSPAKLREKWTTLSAKKKQGSPVPPPQAEQVPHWNSRESWEEFI